MNKEELKERINDKISTLSLTGKFQLKESDRRYWEGKEDVTRELFNLIDQLDEPEKVVVPRFVAEWIKDYKEQGYTLSNAIFNIVGGQEELDIEEYFREKPKTFIRAWECACVVEENLAEPKSLHDIIDELKNDNEQTKAVNRELKSEIKEIKKQIKKLKKEIKEEVQP